MGNNVVPTTKINTPFSCYQTTVCSYNYINNQYFVTWNDFYTQAICAIISATGKTLLSEVELGSLPQGMLTSIVLNSFSTKDDKYLITWYEFGGMNGYFNTFTVTPPISFTERLIAKYHERV